MTSLAVIELALKKFKTKALNYKLTFNQSQNKLKNSNILQGFLFIFQKMEVHM